MTQMVLRQKSQNWEKTTEESMFNWKWSGFLLWTVLDFYEFIIFKVDFISNLHYE